MSNIYFLLYASKMLVTFIIESLTLGQTILNQHGLPCVTLTAAL